MRKLLKMFLALIPLSAGVEGSTLAEKSADFSNAWYTGDIETLKAFFLESPQTDEVFAQIDEDFDVPINKSISETEFGHLQTVPKSTDRHLHIISTNSSNETNGK